jgi:transposase, IS5 family
MGPKTPVPEGDFFRHPLREQINLKHPLVRLAELIDRDRLSVDERELRVAQRAASDVAAPDCRPALFAARVRPIGRRGRLAMGGEPVLEATKRAGVIKATSVKRVIVDTTVMEKAIAHPTDSRLLERCREHLVKAAARHGLKPRQNYNREAPRLADQFGRYAHAKQYKRMRKALRTLRSRAGRVMRDVERQLGAVADCSRGALQELIANTKRILSQKTKDKNKLYALHAPEVECLAKG